MFGPNYVLSLLQNQIKFMQPDILCYLKAFLLFWSSWSKVIGRTQWKADLDLSKSRTPYPPITSYKHFAERWEDSFWSKRKQFVKMISRSPLSLAQQFDNSKVSNSALPSDSASTVVENEWRIMEISNAKLDVYSA